MQLGGRWGVFALTLAVWRSSAGAKPVAAIRAQTPQVSTAVRTPLLFKEEWRPPPHEGAPTDQNMHFTPAVVTNERLQATLYGTTSSAVIAATHEGRTDLWTGLATSPVAVTLKNRKNSARGGY